VKVLCICAKITEICQYNEKAWVDTYHKQHEEPGSGEAWVDTYLKQQEEPGSGEACGGLIELEYDGVDLRSHDMQQPDGHRYNYKTRFRNDLLMTSKFGSALQT
jgi:hypothetical protein